jgi:CHAT domain-containing protein/Tfp pilus assembly protein PilF
MILRAAVCCLAAFLGSLPSARAQAAGAAAWLAASGSLQVEWALAEGEAALDRGAYEDAKASFEQALGFAQRLGDRRAAARSLRGLGDVADDRGDRSTALSAFQEALAAAVSLEDRRLEAQLNQRLGVIASHDGRYDVALELLEKALAAAEGSQAKSLRASVLNNLGVLYVAQGRSELATDYWKRALAQYEEIDDQRDRLRVLNNLGVAHLAPGKTATAVEYFTKLLALDDEVGMETVKAGHWRNLGLAHELAGDFAAARLAYEKSLAAAETLGMADETAVSHEALTRIFLLTDDIGPAMEHSRRALAHFRTSGAIERVWRSLVHEGIALRALGRAEEARRVYLEAVGIIEQTRESATGSGLALGSFLAARVIAYHEMADLSAASGDLLAALDWAEAAKARVLYEIRADRRGTAAAHPDEEALERRLVEQNVKLLRADAAGRAAAEAELARARFDLEALRARLFASRPGLRLRRADLPPLAAADLAALVADGKTAVLSYTVLDDQTLLLLVRHSAAPPGFEVRSFNVPIRTLDLSAAVGKLHRGLAERRLDWAATARELYRFVLAPVEQLLTGTTRLVVVADGALWNLPFHALTDASGRFVIDRWAVSYAPSLRLLSEMAKGERPVGAATLLAVGNALAGGLGEPAALRGRSLSLAPLPDAEREVRSLARFYPQESRRVLLGRDAAEREVKAAAGRFSVLHFAGHAVFDDAAPLHSFLLLSPQDGEEDGLLETWEIADLDLPADLVVLSACETASGRMGVGEGLLGLAWAFMAAGAQGVVASQWPVDSAATGTLMVSFHRGLAAGVAADEALRQASRALRDADGGVTRHPFYWAPFVLLGAPEPSPVPHPSVLSPSRGALRSGPGGPGR